ncbi:LPD25 domain-containing protein [Buttiauxella noackiae]|uniref:LPD25 domain-containing protein n=1 Tax=Buttiauxella noackiae TaxID=82992 RepID=UPI00068F7024|nr:LPD25 domain-containing protein [Buttiauxella noackiae]
MATNAIIRKNELSSLLEVAQHALNEVSKGKPMKQFKAVLGIVCRLRTDFIAAVSQIIEKIKTELTDVMHDVNAVNGEVVTPEVKVTRSPVSVLVHWSESSVFKDEEQVYTFADFERLAKDAAICNGNVIDNGYSKTKVTVALVNDITGCTESYGCRLDLALGDVVGFRDHAQQMIRYHETAEGAAYHKAIGLVSHVEFLKTINWGV